MHEEHRTAWLAFMAVTSKAEREFLEHTQVNEPYEWTHNGSNS